MATGTLRVRKPATVRITISCNLAAGVTAKDLALVLLVPKGGRSSAASWFAAQILSIRVLRGWALAAVAI